MAVEDEVTEEMPFEPVGLHQGCGGEVRLIWGRNGGFELCLLCGETLAATDPIDQIHIEWEERENGERETSQGHHHQVH